MSKFQFMQFLKEMRDSIGVKIEVSGDEELAELEKKWNTKLPLAYKEVFKIKGKYGAFSLRGNEFSIDEFEKMQQEVRDIIRRNKLEIDLDKVFVFSCFASLGNFCFYRLDEGENPPVYIFIEGDETYKKAYNSFVDFIKSEGWYEAYCIRNGLENS